jgi:acylphosphatase
MLLRRVRVRVAGRVQGVWFREHTCREAERLALAGWVRNRADGTVEAVLEGEKEGVAAMLRWLERGSPQAVVREVTLGEEPPRGEQGPFAILPSR